MDSGKVILVILDGWGLGADPASDAMAAADTPFFDHTWAQFPNSTLLTHGEHVGLPGGQMGNSEVGHLNIGAGRVVYQELARINREISDGHFFNHPALLQAMNHAKTKQSALHLIGLVSDGGVHAHLNHLKALCDMAAAENLEKVFIHAFTDGRDTDPKSGTTFLKDLLAHIQNQPARLASVVGRYYAMDRDQRWERVKVAYDLLVNGRGTLIADPVTAIQEAYEKGLTDEFLPPMVLSDNGNNPRATIQKNDAVIFYNFRTDRPRQLTRVLTQEDMPEYEMKTIPLHFTTMTRYDETFKKIEVVFEKDDLKNTLGEVLSKYGKTQVRIAETEKYPHVTFFFSGGREQPFEHEKRILIPSPKVATYDQQPEMSAVEVTNAIVREIQENRPDFVCLNYANADMVGHTGDFQAAIQAAQTVDACLQRLSETAIPFGYSLLVIADHGNSDYMINPDGSPNTAHTLNPVPCILLSQRTEGLSLKNGRLADVAPTILHLMKLSQPEEMTGVNLLVQSEP
jgi:2,3-bisphosphoglycerate-independent phosphoglycerate mutase